MATPHRPRSRAGEGMSCVHPHGPCRRILGDDPEAVDGYCIPCLRNNLRKVREVLKKERETHAWTKERLEKGQEARRCVTCGGSVCPPMECGPCIDRSIEAGNRTTIQRHAAAEMMREEREEAMSEEEGFVLQQQNEYTIRSVRNGFLISQRSQHNTKPKYYPSSIAPGFRDLVEDLWSRFYKPSQGEAPVGPCPILIPKDE